MYIFSFNGESYCGDYNGFELANECDTLEAFLHLPGATAANGTTNGSKPQPAPAAESVPIAEDDEKPSNGGEQQPSGATTEPEEDSTDKKEASEDKKPEEEKEDEQEKKADGPVGQVDDPSED